MDSENYPLEKDASQTSFYFDSVGPRGTIKKVVAFKLIDPNQQIWNLGFGDVLPDGSWDDSADSNNGDLVAVMATVVRAAVLFTDQRPGSALFLNPFDSRRLTLYRQILIRNRSKIEELFEIYGRTKRAFEPFEPTLEASAFLIVRKATNFDKN